MCGIIGIVNFKTGRAPDQNAVVQAAESLSHRGPDDDGVYTNGPACLAFRRLSIIDLKSGAQPMCNEDGTLWVVYNGEIYNFAELRTRLQKQGHTFKTRSDTEVILHEYEQKGDACLSSFNGMFAFALWDSRKKRLLLGRDRLGIKPLYYTLTPDGIAFASELKALLQLPGVERHLNEQALCNYLTFRYVPGAQTMFSGIHKLPPGHFLIVENGAVSDLQEYWDLTFAPNTHVGRRDEDLVEEFDILLARAVKSHLVSDVPLGVLLSGGLDSTAMAAYMQGLGVTDLKTFSVAFDTGGVYDERPFAREAAQAYNTDHHEIVLSSKDFQDLLPQVVRSADEPLADLATVPLFAVSRLAREHVKVVLSGEGSDELFGGYPGIENILQQGQLLAKLHHIPAPLRQIAGWLLRTVSNSEKIQKATRAFSGPIENFAQAIGVSMTRVFTSTEKTNLLNGLSEESIGAAEMLLANTYAQQRITDPLNQILYMYSKLWLPDDLLAKADRMTMANSLELRVPFLDNDLVRFTSSLPTRLKIRKDPLTGQWNRKYILRSALKGRIPESILTREKQGFPVPAYEWLATDLREFAGDRLTSRSSPLSDFFKPETVEQLFHRSTEGDHRAQRQAWVLLIFLLWHETDMQ